MGRLLIGVLIGIFMVLWGTTLVWWLGLAIVIGGIALGWLWIINRWPMLIALTGLMVFAAIWWGAEQVRRF